MKQLSLMMVLLLAVAPLSSATITGLSVDGTTTPDVDGVATVGLGGVITISCIGDTASGFEYLDMAKGYATMATPVATAAAGDLAGVFDWSTGVNYDFELTTADSGGSYPGGVVFNANITATGIVGDTFTVDVLDGVNYAVLDTVTVTIVPEPATIALLGLGGLLLRKRK